MLQTILNIQIELLNPLRTMHIKNHNTQIKVLNLILTMFPLILNTSKLKDQAKSYNLLLILILSVDQEFIRTNLILKNNLILVKVDKMHFENDFLLLLILQRIYYIY